MNVPLEFFIQVFSVLEKGISSFLLFYCFSWILKNGYSWVCLFFSNLNRDILLKRTILLNYPILQIWYIEQSPSFNCQCLFKFGFESDYKEADEVKAGFRILASFIWLCIFWTACKIIFQVIITACLSAFTNRESKKKRPKEKKFFP